MMRELETGTARVVCFGEVLLRLAAPAPQLLLQDMVLVPSFCGAEANVAMGLAGLGHSCRLVTALPDNPVGEAARRVVTGFGPQLCGPVVPGGRMGLYFLQPGAMARAAGITYDRAGSAFAVCGPGDFDWGQLLANAEWLFASGITAALGDGPLAALREAFSAARAAGVRIAFDTNYRAALWQGREGQAAEILREFSLEADLLFAGRRATALMAGGRFDHADPVAGFHAAARTMFELSPNLRHMAATRRVVHSAERQDLTGLLANRDGVSASPTIMLDPIVDRVGTGDAFAAGIMHGLLEAMPRENIAQFAARCAQWAHSVPGDFLRASPADIAGLGSGGDVRR